MADEEFQAVVKEALNSIPGIAAELAGKFEVAISTIERWASGVSRPHPRLSKMIADYIKNRITP